MNIKHLLQTFVSAGLLALAVTGALMWWMIDNQATLLEAGEARYESYQLGQEVTVTSDTLTRLARTYVVTGDTRYRDQYRHLVQVLEGKAPRPDGRTIAFDALLKEKGFTAQELELLARANELSLALVETEERAFGIIEGNGKGTREDAIRLVHDSAYHAAIDRINQPVSQFQILLDQRTKRHYETLVAGARVKAWGVLVLVLLVAVLLVAGYLVFVRHITRPLDRLVLATERVVTGDLATTLAEEGAGEMARVSRAFNAMIAHLRDLIAGLTHTSHELHTATAEVRRTMLDAGRGVQHQQRLTQQVAAASTQLASSASEVARSCTVTADAGERAHVAADAGIEVANGAERHMQALETKVNASRDELERLNKVMADVGNIIGLIQDVADQTNLLALNAAIEAARAGEQGRGFAVVADEVRTLAKRTRESTGDVRSRIEELLAGAAKARATMRESVTASGGMREQIALVTSQLGAISQAVHDIRDQSTQIAAAAQEQAAVSANVGEEIESVSTLANEIDSSTRTTLKSVEGLDRLATELITRVDYFKGT